MARLRRVETGLAWFALAGLVVFAPGETWVTLQMSGGGLGSLLHPLYLIDFIGMVLILAGAVHSLRARPRPAPGLLCAATAWMAANGWRASWARIEAMQEGEALFYGASELRMVVMLTAVSLAAMGLALYLAWHAARAPRAAGELERL